MNEEYLQHYGVLGMKWGVRKKGANYRYKSHYTKKLENKAGRASRRGDLANAYSLYKQADISARLDKKMSDHVTKETGLPTTLFAALTIGTGVSKSYQQYKASGNGGFLATGKSLGSLIFTSAPVVNVVARNINRKNYINRNMRGAYN